VAVHEPVDGIQSPRRRAAVPTGASARGMRDPATRLHLALRMELFQPRDLRLDSVATINLPQRRCGIPRSARKG